MHFVHNQNNGRATEPTRLSSLYAARADRFDFIIVFILIVLATLGMLLGNIANGGTSPRAALALDKAIDKEVSLIQLPEIEVSGVDGKNEHFSKALPAANVVVTYIAGWCQQCIERLDDVGTETNLSSKLVIVVPRDDNAAETYAKILKRVPALAGVKVLSDRNSTIRKTMGISQIPATFKIEDRSLATEVDGDTYAVNFLMKYPDSGYKKNEGVQ